MAAAIALPAALEPAFRQFSRDFTRLTGYLIAVGEETPETVAAARAALRAYLAIPDDPDAYGVPRAARLCHVFDWWREAARRTQGPALVAVQPTLSDAAESRIADLWWKRRPS